MKVYIQSDSISEFFRLNIKTGTSFAAFNSLVKTMSYRPNFAVFETFDLITFLDNMKKVMLPDYIKGYISSLASEDEAHVQLNIHKNSKAIDIQYLLFKLDMNTFK